MKGKLLVLLLVCLLVFTSLVSAVTLETVGFYTPNDNEIKIIGPVFITSSLQFDIITAVPLVEFFVDLSSVNSERSEIYDEMRLGFLNSDRSAYSSELSISTDVFCKDNVDSDNKLLGYSCKIPNLKLNPVEESFDIDFSFFVPGTRFDLSHTFKLTKDLTPPVAEKFYTNYCDAQDRCFVAKRHPVKLSLGVDSGLFSPNKVWFDIGSTTSYFEICADGACEISEFRYDGTCQSGKELTIRLDSLSRDAVGNKFEKIISNTFFCDASAPEIIEFKHSEPQMPYPYYKTGDEIILSAIVSEDASGVSAYANLSGLTGNNNSEPGECVLMENEVHLYNCSWLARINPGHANNVEIVFDIKDGVGRNGIGKQSDVIKIDTLIIPEDEDRGLDLFNHVKGVPNSPAGYSRLALGIAISQKMEYPVFASFKPKPKENVEIISTNIRSCDYFNGSEYFDSSRLNIKVTLLSSIFDYSDGAKNGVKITFASDDKTITNTINNEFDLVCVVEMTVRQDGEVYQDTADFNLTIPIILKDTAVGENTFGEAYADKMLKQQERIEGPYGDTIEKTGEILAEVGKWCGVLNKATAVGGVLTQTETGTSACSVFGGVTYVKEACGAVDKGLNFVNKGIGKGITNSLLEDGKLVGEVATALFGIEMDDSIFQSICKMATCSGGKKTVFGFDNLGFGDDSPLKKFNEGAGNYDYTNGGDIEDAGALNSIKDDLFMGVLDPDPKESIIAAAQTLCLPAVVYHLQKIREMECAQLTCYKRMGQEGHDISSCDRMKAQSQCMEVIGAAFSVSPTKAIENLVDNFNTIIQNSLPTIMKAAASQWICPAIESEIGVNKILKLTYMIGCELPRSFSKISYAFSETSHGGTSFTYPIMDGCALALCDADDMNDCGTAIPAYLQQFAETSKAPHLAPDSINLDPIFINNILTDFIDKADKGVEFAPGSGTMDSVSLYTGIDFEARYNEIDWKDGKREVNDGALKDIMADMVYQAKKVIPVVESIKDVGGSVTFDTTTDPPTPNIDWTDFDDDGNVVPFGIATSALSESRYAYEHLDVTIPPDLQKILDVDGVVYKNGKLVSNTYFTGATMTKLSDGVSPPEYSLPVPAAHKKDARKYMNVKSKFNEAQENYDETATALKKKSLLIEGGAAGESGVGRDVHNKRLELFPPSQEEKRTQITIDNFRSEIKDYKGVVTMMKTVPDGEFSVKLFEDAGFADLIFVGDETPKEKEAIVANLNKDPAAAIKHIDEKIAGLEGQVVMANDYIDQLQENPEQTQAEKDAQIKAQDERNLAAIKQNDKNVQASIGMATDLLAQKLMENDMLDWLQWEDNVGFISDALATLDDVLNSEKRKQKICNQYSLINTDEGYGSNVVQCSSSGFCTPVLTFGAEKIPSGDGVNHTYTITWNVGNVIDERQNIPDDDKFLRYNVFLRGGGPQFTLGEGNWAEIPYGEGQFHEVKLHIEAEDNYEDICFEFEKLFPPQAGLINGDDEFCRKIRDTTTGKSFNTGNPAGFNPLIESGPACTSGTGSCDGADDGFKYDGRT